MNFYKKNKLKIISMITKIHKKNKKISEKFNEIFHD